MQTETPIDAETRYKKSRQLFERAQQVIPGGIYGHFSPAAQQPPGRYPTYCARAEGARFWDVDGNEYIDYLCAYGPMILGYGNPVVNEAYRSQLATADICTLASPVMVDLAEYMVDLIPAADWALFAKNGADTTNLAVMIARAATGREKVIAIEGGYHGSSPWMQAADRRGVMEADLANVIRIHWNDLDMLEQAIAEHEDKIAAFISSPYHHPVFQDNELPAEGYWSGVQEILNRNGIVFISDDVRAGFRVDMGGSNEYFGYKPDLICFCKAIGNGYPISALVGIEALQEEASTVFQTGSFWFQAGPMAAALACLKELKRLDAPRVIQENGAKLIEGMSLVAESHGLSLKATGMNSMPYLRIVHEAGIKFHRAVCGECAQRGVYFSSHHNHFLSTAHTGEDIQKTCEIYDRAIAAVEEMF